MHEEDLDHTPLKFGKFKGKTPEWVSENELLAAGRKSWLIWAYETVGNGDVCSEALYREMGGKHSRAKPDPEKPDYRKWKPEAQQHLPDFPETREEAAAREAANDARDRYNSRGFSPAKPASSFDDMDDDIPF